MPSVSLVVCLYREKELLERLLQRAAGSYDDLVVVHDGPDTTGVRQVVEAAGGAFYEHPKIGSLEGQSPFAWAQARHDWILRLDADEFPSQEMLSWLDRFRLAEEPGPDVSGYTCFWPLWNGTRAISRRWPGGRIFLFHRQRVRFFGLVEETPIPDGRYEPLPFVLHHQPLRRSLGLRNVLVRKQAYAWRVLIARGLLGRPLDLPCWRWDSEKWPDHWEQIRRHPLQTAMRRLIMETLRNLRSQWRVERRFWLGAALNSPVHHAMICIKYWQLKRKRNREPVVS